MATRVKIIEILNADDRQENIVRMGGQIIEEVLKHEEKFRAEVEAADFSGGTSFRHRSGRVESKSADEVLEITLNGIERSTTGDGELDMRIELRPHKRGIVGTANLGNQPIKPAYWFVEQCARTDDGVSMARHLIHEWLHVAGFFHQSSGANQDDVPYEIGDIVRRIAKSLADAKLIPAALKHYMEEDSLAAHWLDEAEDEVDFDAGVVRTITKADVPEDVQVQP